MGLAAAGFAHQVLRDRPAFLTDIRSSTERSDECDVTPVSAFLHQAVGLDWVCWSILYLCVDCQLSKHIVWWLTWSRNDTVWSASSPLVWRADNT